MERSYTLDRSLTFSEDTGYWTLHLAVIDSRGVSPKPFLLEKVILGSGISTTLGSDIGYPDTETEKQKPQYLRTLLESESATQRDITDGTVYDKYTWVKYRASEFYKEFYTYEQAADSLKGIMAILKSNVRVFETPKLEPRLVGVNLSSKEKETSFTTLALVKGDTVSLQLVNGSADTRIFSDGDFLLVSGESPSNAVRSNSYVVTVTSDDMSFIGVIDNNTGTEYRLQVTMLPHPLEGSSTEVIQ